MMGLGLIWLIVLAAIVAYLLGWRPENLNSSGSRQQSDEKTPMGILRERYAQGEITKEEFEGKRADLER